MMGELAGDGLRVVTHPPEDGVLQVQLSIKAEKGRVDLVLILLGILGHVICC